MNENMGKLWTKEEDDRLKVAINNGGNLQKICQDHGRTPYGVTTRLQQLGVLTHIGNAFYRVFSEPWETDKTVYRLQYPNGRPKK